MAAHGMRMSLAKRVKRWSYDQKVQMSLFLMILFVKRWEHDQRVQMSSFLMTVSRIRIRAGAKFAV